MAVATAITGGVVALSCPAAAHADTTAPSVPGHRVSYDVGDAPTRALAITQRTPVGGEDDEDEVVSRKKCCKKCPPGPPGPPGPRGRTDAIDSAMATPTGQTAPVPLKYVGLAQANGVALIRDPTSIGPANPPWHDISTVPNYPGRVNEITLAANQGHNLLHVTVRTPTGLVRHTVCTLSVNGAWPGNCTPFTDITPPN